MMQVELKSCSAAGIKLGGYEIQIISIIITNNKILIFNWTQNEKNENIFQFQIYLKELLSSHQNF